MKMSEVTAELAANYARADYTNMTVAEKAEFAVILAAAKAFIKSYTGLADISPIDEAVGTGDGVETIFTLAYHPVTASSYTVYVDGVAQTVTTDYTIVESTGVITFVNAPTGEITASYSAVPSDGFEDMVIACYVLCQDMHDNRAMVVDKASINRTVDTILGMHCTNLL